MFPSIFSRSLKKDLTKVQDGIDALICEKKALMDIISLSKDKISTINHTRPSFSLYDDCTNMRKTVSINYTLMEKKNRLAKLDILLNYLYKEREWLETELYGSSRTFNK